MTLGLSTHWNAYRHTTGEALVDELLALGFADIEAGYDLRLDLVTGLRRRVEAGAVRVHSVHGPCPVPVGLPEGHPEWFLLADPEARRRDRAVRAAADTVRFAAEIGARAVVMHAGRMHTRPRTADLIDLCARGRQYSPRYERLHTKLIMRRQRREAPYFEALCRSIDDLLPTLEQHGVCLALENLPSWETLPSEVEMQRLFARYATPRLAFWYDTGHGQIRQTLGFSSPLPWLERFGNRVAGMHIHDVLAPLTDHAMPPRGMIRFDQLKTAVHAAMILTLEPAPGLPPEDVVAGKAFLETLWADPAAEPMEPPASGRAGLARKGTDTCVH